jgi:flagellar biosynthetic protein FlhB
MASGESADQERTEQPTGKRRDEARREGQVAKSVDLTLAVGLLGSLGFHGLVAGSFVTDALAVFQDGFRVRPRGDFTIDGAMTLAAETAFAVARLGWPFVAVPAVLTIAVQLLQTRFALSSKALRPQWNRLSPREGLSRLLSWRGAVEWLKAVFKLVGVGAVGYYTIRSDWPLLLSLGAGGTQTTLVTLGRVVWDLWLAVGVSYLLLAGFDYAYQWWEHERSLRMTKKELREEVKHTEGNPLLRGRMRALHRQMATRRMMTEVKKADVVLRNPTHYAVAIKYKTGQMRAPRVVAKGARLMALRIIDVARKANVVVVENPPLARALYKSVPVGRDIPRELYRAVAEVLAYVYSLRGPRS